MNVSVSMPPWSGEQSPGAWRPARKWLAGVVTAVVVVPLSGLAFPPFREWLIHQIGPEEYLSAIVDVPSPQHTCVSGEGWVFEQDRQDLPGVAPDQDKVAWAAANGGIPASGNIVEVRLRSLNGHTVVVTDIDVQVVSRSDPPRGTHPYTGGQCGRLIPYRFQADLDTDPVVVTPRADDGAVGRADVRRPVQLPRAIRGAEPEVWHIAAVTESCTCEWTATLKWNSDGKQGETEITDDGRPFRVAATTQAEYLVTDYIGGWRPPQ